MLRTIPIIVIIVVLVLVPLLNAAAEPPGAPVRAAEVEQKQVRQGRRFVGSVLPLRHTQLSAGVEGFVASLSAREGSRVEAGEVIAQLELDLITPQLEAARAELERIDQVVLQLENGPRKELIVEARERLVEAEVDVRSAERKLVTARRLQESKHISTEEVRDAEDAVRAAEAALRRLTAGVALLEAGTREEEVAQARAQRKVQLAEIRRLEAVEQRHTIKAPFAGYVIEEHTEKGAWLSQGDAVITLEALDTVRVRFPVLEDYVHSLRPGDDVAVQLGSMPDRIFQGQIERIIPAADPTARTVPVDVIVANEKADGGVLIKPGMFAHTSLPVGKPIDALLVPLDALVLGGRTPVVYIVGDDNTASPTPVELSVAIGGKAVVVGELKAGMKVVTEGNERLRPGQPVQILED